MNNTNSSATLSTTTTVCHYCGEAFKAGRVFRVHLMMKHPHGPETAGTGASVLSSEMGAASMRKLRTTLTKACFAGEDVPGVHPTTLLVLANDGWEAFVAAGGLVQRDAAILARREVVRAWGMARAFGEFLRGLATVTAPVWGSEAETEVDFYLAA